VDRQFPPDLDQLDGSGGERLLGLGLDGRCGLPDTLHVRDMLILVDRLTEPVLDKSDSGAGQTTPPPGRALE
jgi:hypothetical protein